MAKAKVKEEAAPAAFPFEVPEGVKFLLKALGRVALAKLSEWLEKQGTQLRTAAQEELRAEIAAQAPQAEAPPAA